MSLRKPIFLTQGDEIIMLSPAKKISPSETEYFVKLCQNWGLVLITAPHCYASWGQFAGTDDERYADLQWALNHSSAKAILCSRGGYGLSRIIDKLDFSVFMQKPKWLLGFSDVTNLHLLINGHLKISSIHSPMPLNITSDAQKADALKSVRNALFGEKLHYEIPSSEHNVCGEAEAEIIGGNLSIIMQAAATQYDLVWQNKILFLEEVGESLYHVDRMLVNLKRRGIFSQIKGLIIGGFTEVEDKGSWFTYGIEQLILSHLGDCNYPVCFHFPAGHIDDNRALLFQFPAKLSVEKNTCRLQFLHSKN